MKTTVDKSSENTTNTFLQFIDSHQDQIVLNKILRLIKIITATFANLFNHRDTEFPTLDHIDAIINLKCEYTSASF